MDPLKPFSTVIRSLWEQTTRPTAPGDKSRAVSTTAHSTSRPTSAATPALPIDPLRARLRARFTGGAAWDAAIARTAFVESVVLDELGNHLAADPAFGSVVGRVSEQLANDPTLSAQLDQLLKRVVDLPGTSLK